VSVRVCLVSAPTLADFRNLEPFDRVEGQRLPLGVLALASCLERSGVAAQVVDLDHEYVLWRRASGRRGDFARHVVEDLAARDADVYGLGTICSSYPLTLRIATALREVRPGCRIVLGGPQATVAADETLAAFPAVDLVVRGEGELVVPELVDALAAGRDLDTVRSLTYRTPRGVARTPDAPLIEDLDALPLPAYHLAPHPRRGEPIPIEAGRGCPYSCLFCSTNRFFGRRYRMRSPARLVEAMIGLGQRFGTRRFDLVHDNFTVDRRTVLAFCEAVSKTGARLRWTCSSRTDTIDDGLVDAMWRAGCRGFFFGIESGSAAMQRTIDKRLDLAGARDRLRRVSRRRMSSTLSFITGFPEERERDLRDTLSLFVDALRVDFLGPQISLLSPLPGTPLHERHRDTLVLDGVVSDIAFQGEAQQREDRALIVRHRDIFSSFYAVPTRWLDRGELADLHGFLTAARFELRWLLVALEHLPGGVLAAFRAFRAWRPAARAPSPEALRAYYRGRRFQTDLLRFVRERLARDHPADGAALRSLARYYGSLRRASPEPVAALHPVLARDVRVSRLPCDGAALIECLRRGGDLASIPQRPSTLVTRVYDDRHEILSVSGEAADVLALCDGKRDARAIARAFRRKHAEIAGASAAEACAFALALFRQKGLIRVPARAPRRREGAARRAA
jgi:hypothetical protein